jgi:hypothetical protein
MPNSLEKLRTLIFTSLGEASMCWEDLDKAGIFKSRECADVGERLIQDIMELLDNPIYD